MTRLDELLTWYSTLTADSVKLATDYYHPGARFKDPFNEVQGVAAIMRIFDHMFVTTQNPRFIINDRIWQDQQAFVSWIFEFELKGRKYSILGASHLRFDVHGLVISHRDYWDTAEELFQKLPLIGAPVRWLRGRFRSPD
jgi:SnoaL-like domain